LEEEHGEIWWPKGVPLNVRKKLAVAREEAGAQEAPLSFAHVVDFLEIIDHSKNWPLFAVRLRAAGFGDRKEFKSDFVRFNELRNLLHGAREQMPDAADLDFAREFAERIRRAVQDQ